MTKNRQSDMRTRKQTCVSQEIDITFVASSVFSQLLRCFEAREKRLRLHIAPFLLIILMHASSMSSQAEYPHITPFLFIILVHASSMSSQAECLHIAPFLCIILVHASSISSQAEYSYFLSQP